MQSGARAGDLNPTPDKCRRDRGPRKPSAHSPGTPAAPTPAPTHHLGDARQYVTGPPPPQTPPPQLPQSFQQQSFAPLAPHRPRMPHHTPPYPPRPQSQLPVTVAAQRPDLITVIRAKRVCELSVWK
ncbi:uncharacterized protein LOC126982258 [Eriocheir sinensis]|uniref:uncharacterized protein LOC126982258 n=1 Tax=Eriocheir sinensis TaxID=95602 RepID=UPI0021C7835A|nr:uncharacterized protein LOC126982258 [Eriocheir sinensis]